MSQTKVGVEGRSKAAQKGKGKASVVEDKASRMQLEIIICTEGGCGSELKWCPLGAYDEVSSAFRPVTSLSLTFDCY